MNVLEFAFLNNKLSTANSDTFFRRLWFQCRMTVAELMNKSDHDLFWKLCAPTHALLLPARNCVSLWTRGHSYQLFLSIVYIALSSEIISSFAALYCVPSSLSFLCLLFDVRLSHLINITYNITKWWSDYQPSPGHVSSTGLKTLVPEYTAGNW